MMKRIPVCHIVCALPQSRPLPKAPGDLLIAADGGFAQLAGAKADLVVGDFDSLGYIPEGVAVVRHPVRKDDTDTMLAARIGLERGYRAFILYGGVGGRLDHTVANFQTLAFLRGAGAHAALLGESETITLIRNESLRFRAGLRGTVSAFSYGGAAAGVTEKGLTFPLEEATLTDDNPLGVSNAFTGKAAEICVREGRLLVFYAGAPEDSDLFERNHDLKKN